MAEVGVRSRTSARPTSDSDDALPDLSANKAAMEISSNQSLLEMSWKDKLSFGLLFILYTLQGIPMGLCSSIPLLLRERGGTYEALSLFSMVSLPFSMKIIWAPVVDTYYFPSFGRRKSWLVPVQFLTAAVMIFGARHVGFWLQDSPSTSESGSNSGQMDVFALTVYFFLLYFMMATQDIAVDGWALNMLSSQNVGYASIANAVGQSFGVFLSNQGFLALSDEKWCRRFLSSTSAVVDLPDFIVFWGYVFFITTVIVWLMKKEERETQGEGDIAGGGLWSTMQQVFSICRLKSIVLFTAILLTVRAASGPIDAAILFKLQEYGLPKSDITNISPLLLITSLVFPALASTYVAQKPLQTMLVGVKCKLLTSLMLLAVFQYTAFMYKDHTNASGSSSVYYASLILSLLLNECADNLIFVSLMAFFSRISDPNIGGSYITLLNTLTNLGSKWPAILSLYLLPKLTFYSDMNTNSDVKSSITVDGLTVLTSIGLLLGMLWLIVFAPILKRLETLPHSDWLVATNKGGGDNINKDKSC